jgi:hypothetical protein
VHTAHRIFHIETDQCIHLLLTPLYEHCVTATCFSLQYSGSTTGAFQQQGQQNELADEQVSLYAAH